MKNSDSELLRAALSRRSFLGGVGTVAGLSLVARYGGLALAQPSTALRFDKTPFSLGVASGDPLPTGVVLWTKLAPAPLNGGGMPPQDVPVRWQIASDQSMKRIVQKGTATATAMLGHSVHVEVEGLRPGTHYWYQFETGGVLSPVGRTKTAPAPGSRPDRVRFAFVSCQQWQAGYFIAYRDIAKQDLDFVSHLGDYIYESRIPETGRSNVRMLELPAPVRQEPTTLEQYRLRYSLYRLDPDLQAAHAAHPFIVTWDDHEVDNNYASDIDQDNSPTAGFLQRRAQAYQVYYEFMPLRRTSMPHGPNDLLFRRLAFGDLMQFNVLDTRQYRSNQACGDGEKKPCAETLDPGRGLMGKPQERWLMDGMAASTARWNVVAQQIIMTQFGHFASATDETFNMDAWDGYPVERQRLMNFLATVKPRNPVVLAGDSHTNLISDLKANFDDPKSAIVGAEFAGTSISSNGVSVERQPSYLADLSAQPHLKWFEGTKRGYMLCDLDRQRWHTDVYQVENARDPKSSIAVGSSWVVEDGKPGVQKA